MCSNNKSTDKRARTQPVIVLLSHHSCAEVPWRRLLSSSDALQKCSMRGLLTSSLTCAACTMPGTVLYCHGGHTCVNTGNAANAATEPCVSMRFPCHCRMTTGIRFVSKHWKLVDVF
eukprot:scpid69186/ scgid11775/ 